jgi:hypothetical protein
MVKLAFGNNKFINYSTRTFVSPYILIQQVMDLKIEIEILYRNLIII